MIPPPPTPPLCLRKSCWRLQKTGNKQFRALTCSLFMGEGVQCDWIVSNWQRWDCPVDMKSDRSDGTELWVTQNSRPGWTWKPAGIWGALARTVKLAESLFKLQSDDGLWSDQKQSFCTSSNPFTILIRSQCHFNAILIRSAFNSIFPDLSNQP